MSKRCCPVCAFLLFLLNKHKGTDFVISDEHNNITPCAVPDWLPEEIVLMMVMEFSSRLREALSKLQKSISEARARSASIDTTRMSLESVRPTMRKGPKEADMIEAFSIQTSQI